MPGPRGLAIPALLLALRRDPLRGFLDARARWGPCVRVPLGARTFYLVADPAAARHVLVDNARNYSKDTFSYGLLRSVLGDGVLTSDGAAWRRQRRIVQPAFHRSQVAALAADVVRHVDATLARWPRGAEVDVGAAMTTLGLRVVSGAILGVDLGADADAVGDHLMAALAHLMRRTHSLVAWPAWWPQPAERRFRARVAALDDIVARVIERRRRGRGGDGADLVAALLDARDEDGTGLDDAAIRDQVKTFLLAGHETTANLLTWAFGLLAAHPASAARVRAELDSVLGGAPPTAAHLPALEETERVLRETLRLYPPIWLVERRALEADTLAGAPVPAGAPVAVCQYVLHRDPDVWPEPERFDPDRFAPAAEAARPRGAYLPFGAGARTCIGEGFALMQAKLVVARVLQRMRPVPLAELPRPIAYATLRPGTPLRLRWDDAA
jgi:cytochrome P450